MSVITTVYEALHSKAGLVVLFVVMLLALWNMMRRPAANLSQKLMRWRVGLQFAVICILIGMVIFKF